VLAGDVLGRPPHLGRGGWTWYTGSSSWLYRVGIESILGLRRFGACLSVDPCIPPEWNGFEATYHFRSTTYRIRIENPHGLERGVGSVWLDGQAREDFKVALADDGETHEIRVLMNNL
jgi:cellobiose phosphorylase